MTPANDQAVLSQTRTHLLAHSQPTKLEACPSEELLSRVVAGEASTTEQERVAAHCAVCSACFEDWSIAMALRESIQEQLVEYKNLRAPSHARVADTQPSLENGDAWARPSAGRLKSSPPWAGKALGFCAVAALACLAWLKHGQPQVASAPTDEVNSQIRGASDMSLGDQLAPQFRDARFVWRELPQAQGYALRIFDPNLREIFVRLDLAGSSVALDAEILEKISSYPSFFWQISVTDRNGELHDSVPILQDVAKVR